jgi:hypothetical protein
MDVELDGNDLIVYKTIKLAAEGVLKFELRKKTNLGTT